MNYKFKDAARALLSLSVYSIPLSDARRAGRGNETWADGRKKDKRERREKRKSDIKNEGEGRRKSSGFIDSVREIMNK